MSMQNEPQLSAEIEPTDETYLEADNLFQDSLNKETGNLIADKLVYEMAILLTTRDLALATALEEQRKELLAEVESWLVARQLKNEREDEWTRGAYDELSELRAKLAKMKEGK